MAGNALVEVLEVSVERAPGEGALAGGGIDVPEPGARRPTFDLEIRGWAIDRRSPAVAVEVVHDDIAVGAAPIEIARPKLAARHPATAAGDRIGFRVQLGPLRVPTEFDLAV